MFQSIHYFLFQIEEFSLVQWLTNINVPFTENDKNILIQSRNVNTIKNEIIIHLFLFISVFDNNQINLLLDDTMQEQIYKLAVR